MMSGSFGIGSRYDPRSYNGIHTTLPPKNHQKRPSWCLTYLFLTWGIGSKGRCSIGSQSLRTAGLDHPQGLG